MARPLTPEDCDLQDFPRMMIDIPRLRGSSFDSTLDDSAWRAGVNLWMAAWHQVPAASLENDEAQLAKAAGLGRDVKTWRKVKGEALRGWTACDDGRLYHPTVAEFALEAWIEKLGHRLSSGAGNAKRYGGTFDPAPTYAEITAAADLLRELNPKSRALSKQHVMKALKAPDEGDAGTAGGTPGEPPGGSPAGIVPGSQGKGTGKGTGNKREKDEPSLSARGAAARESRGASKGSKRKPETAIPDGFPDTEALAEARSALASAGVSLDPETLAKRFRNHALAEDRRVRDWSAAWRNWVDIEADRGPKAAASPAEAMPEFVFAGPPELLADIVAKMGEPWARSWLRRCEWQDVPRKALISANSFVVSTLRRELARTLSAHGVTVLQDKGQAA
jgi:hypothetical protein